jgi:VanZ family protein
LSGIIGPLGISPVVIKVANLIVRKCAHFVEYAILGLLTWRALRASWPQRRRRQLLLAAMAIAAAWAGVDELRQYITTAARGGKAQDVVLDAAGALAGAALGAVCLERRGRRRAA